MHLIRENSPDLKEWKNWNFSDPTLQHLLSEDPPLNGKMLDWSTAKSTPDGIEGNWIDGVWWDIITETGWQDMILGKNARGKYTIMKPRHQYFITDRTGENQPPGKRAQVPTTVGGKPGLILVPHTPHTIRKSVRSCESCHESTLTAGLGDSLKRSVTDGKLFAREFKSKNRLLPQFQLKQVRANKGPHLQSAFPPGKTRFLNAKEVTALNKKSDVYRIYRHQNLQRLKLPRLLTRSEFPYDIQHKTREQTYGLPASIEDLYYDFNKNKFFASGTSLNDIIEQRLQEEAQTPKEPAIPRATEMPGFFPEPELRSERRDERMAEPAPGIREPSQDAGEWFPGSPEPPPPTTPPEKPSLDEEGNSILDFFQGIIQQKPPPPIEDELEQ